MNSKNNGKTAVFTLFLFLKEKCLTFLKVIIDLPQRPFGGALNTGWT